jgi:two-component system sensor histidine kinase PilS (NtrC family)
MGRASRDPGGNDGPALRGGAAAGSPDAGWLAAVGGAEGGGIRKRDILRWVYIGRIGIAGGLFVGAAFAWSEALPGRTLAASLALVLTLTLTPISYWFSHIGRRESGSTFIYTQAILDVLLLTLAVHLTGGRESVVAPFYILLISVYTLMLPLRGGILVAAMASIGYSAVVVWGQGTGVDGVVALQIGIFVTVAVVVGLISTKLQRAGAELTLVEQELEQLRLQTDDILKNIPSAIITVDGSGRLAYANPAAERLLGLEAEVWTDEPVLDELERRSAGLRRVLERTRKHGIPVVSAEVEVQRDGESIPVGVSTAVLERGEERASVTAIMRDISDRKLMEQFRRRTERLEAVAELSASLAHEIKNPLASISSSVQQLRLKEEADEDDRLLSTLVLRESDRLSRLLNDFIDFARVHIQRPKELDLRDVVSEALEVVRRHPAYRPEIEIEAKLGPTPVRLHGDEDLLHRVVMNLVLNAVQAAIPGRRTKVVVEVKRGDEACRPGGMEIRDPILLRVTDNGPGIPREDLTRIFDPFFTKRRGGTGLGLAIVHRAVEEHRGTVVVSSSPGSGTRFTVCLPGADAPGPAMAEERQ